MWTADQKKRLRNYFVIAGVVGLFSKSTFLRGADRIRQTHAGQEGPLQAAVYNMSENELTEWAWIIGAAVFILIVGLGALETHFARK